MGSMPSLNRRDFLRYSVAAGTGLVGIEALAACGATGPASGSSTVTATVNSLPAASDPASVKEFLASVASFEKAYPGEKIVGKNDPYDPTTYFARLAAGQAEDGVESYFTDRKSVV